MFTVSHTPGKGRQTWIIQGRCPCNMCDLVEFQKTGSQAQVALRENLQHKKPVPVVGWNVSETASRVFTDA